MFLSIVDTGILNFAFLLLLFFLSMAKYSSHEYEIMGYTNEIEKPVEPVLVSRSTLIV